MIIYKITNMINNKIYIGQTIRPMKIRWQAHKNERNYSDRPICLALVKYGVHNFKIEEIDSASSLDELNVLEQKWIALLDSMNPKVGYNAESGGKNKRASDETRKKQSLAKKGKPSVKKDFSCSEETKRKISEANKGNVAWNKGKPWSEEHKKAHSERMKGKKAWNKGVKINNKPIIAINLETGEEKRFDSIHQVIEELKVGRCAVQNVLSGRRKRTSNNYTYKYA